MATKSKTSAAAGHEFRCKYQSKRCENARVMKRNGEMHRMCEYHRARANGNQKRLDERKRSAKMGENSDESGDLEQQTHDEMAGAEAKDGDFCATRSPPNQRMATADASEANEEKRDLDVSSVDIAQLNPDELDDDEIDALQALVLAGHLMQVQDETKRIGP